jgi:hypothetical protein
MIQSFLSLDKFDIIDDLIDFVDEDLEKLGFLD